MSGTLAIHGFVDYAGLQNSGMNPQWQPKGSCRNHLLVVSFVVGLILATFGFDPETVYESFERGVRRLIEFGLSDFRQFGRILLTGAMVVLPVWFVLRLLDGRRAR